MAGTLEEKDYTEPRCPLSPPDRISKIPMRRITEKLDEYLASKNNAAAERHLSYWLAEAEADGDVHGRLAVLNEQIGFYRKCGNKEKCMAAADEALNALDGMDLDGTVTAATTYINAATGYKAFGRAIDAVPLYRKAKDIYESLLDRKDTRIAALYNNMALALTDTGDGDGAMRLYEQALSILKAAGNSECDMAITYCNMADLVLSVSGSEDARISEYLDEAEKLLDSDRLEHNAYYAFVCEKCASAFGYHGYFLTERKLAARAKDFYERT